MLLTNYDKSWFTIKIVFNETYAKMLCRALISRYGSMYKVQFRAHKIPPTVSAYEIQYTPEISESADDLFSGFADGYIYSLEEVDWSNL